MDGWVDGYTDGWMGKRIDDGWMKGWMDEWMDVQMDGWKNGWMDDGWMDEKIDGWMDGEMEEKDRAPHTFHVLVSLCIGVLCIASTTATRLCKLLSSNKRRPILMNCPIISARSLAFSSLRISRTTQKLVYSTYK